MKNQSLPVIRNKENWLAYLALLISGIGFLLFCIVRLSAYAPLLGLVVLIEIHLGICWGIPGLISVGMGIIALIIRGRYHNKRTWMALASIILGTLLLD